MTEQEATETLIGIFTREGFARVEPPILLPADVFLDLSGEDIRRRMFVTQDSSGTELCLRPEYTIPVCLHHLAEANSNMAAYSYGGSVFRLRHEERGEFVQAGVESFGRFDKEATDAEILDLSLEGLASLEKTGIQVRLGDMGLLHALIDALGVSPTAKRRVIRAIALGQGLTALSEQANATDHAGLLAAIEGQAPQAAKAFVEDILSIAGIARVGGRSAAEIAERFLARAGNRTGLTAQARGILERYLAIEGDPDEAADALHQLIADTQVDISTALNAFEDRNGFMAARGLDLTRFTFTACFARNLDYYTGFIFEIYDPLRSDGKPIVGGGRYDGLLEHLGAGSPIPAVGCAFWLDRIAKQEVA